MEPSLAWSLEGAPAVIFGFTIDDAKIVGIEVIAGPKGFTVEAQGASASNDVQPSDAATPAWLESSARSHPPPISTTAGRALL